MFSVSRNSIFTQRYPYDYTNFQSNQQNNLTDASYELNDIPDELEDALEATIEEKSTDESCSDNEYDETIYSDAVQNAFVQYENEVE